LLTSEINKFKLSFMQSSKFMKFAVIALVILFIVISVIS
jgi:hypothetical protein